MKLYKFKDFTEENNHPHFLQIVLERKIWCASPDSLNDENEFNFELDYIPTPNTASLLAQLIAQNRPLGTWNPFPPNYVASQTLKNNTLENHARAIVDNIIRMTRSELGVTSFSAVKIQLYGKDMVEKVMAHVLKSMFQIHLLVNPTIALIMCRKRYFTLMFF